MSESWIALACPECGQDWEASPSDLPAPDATFQCEHCDEEGRMAGFARTQRSLDILREFQ